MGDAADHSIGMRKRDAVAFRATTKEHALYVLTRHANAESLKYIGVQGYVPKPFYVKSKTARSNGSVKNGRMYEIAGLVVDPGVHPELYEGPRLAQAQELWSGDLKHIRSGRAHGISIRVDENPASKHFGCLQVRRSSRTSFAYVHGDYDLKDIIEKGYESHNERMTTEQWGLIHYEVKLHRTRLPALIKEINERIGVPMIQHGPEVQYTWRADDRITAFLPDGRLRVYAGDGIERFYARIHRAVGEVPRAAEADS